MNENGMIKLEMGDAGNEPQFFADIKNRICLAIEVIKRRRIGGNV